MNKTAHAAAKRIAFFAFCFCMTVLHAETVKQEEFPANLDPDAAFLARMSGLFDVEDPTSIYDFAISDREVECVLDGSWEVNLDSALTINYASGTPVYGFTPPVFTQTVNLKSWVFINHTWYFESSFAEEFTRNTVAAGYIGNDDTVVKHVRLGNSGITFPSDYQFIQVGGGKAIAPGVMGTFAGDNWNADALVRYDAAATGTLELSGMNEISDTLVSVTNPLRGKWFVLPDAPVTGSVSVYVEDSDGSIYDASGRRWRKLDSAEFTVSGILGVVELGTAVTGSVAVTYGGTYASSSTAPGTSLREFVADTVNYFTLEAAKSGRSMPSDYLPTTDDELASRFLLTLDGKTALLVRERGHFSPFDVGMRYLINGSTFELVYTESGIKPTSFSVDAYESEYAEINRSDAGDESGIRTPECRFPLAQEFPYLYLPSYGGMKPDTDLSIRSRTYTPVSSISLGSDVIAGTIIVTRNGISDTGFRFDEDSGILQLDTMPHASEDIKITWYKTDQSAQNGTLTIAGGFRWRPSDPLEFSVASALKWNTSKDGYTDSTDSSPGSYIISTGASWKKDSIIASTAFDFDIQVPDTTGYYRILGMDTTASTLYPSSTWYETVPSSISPVIAKPLNTTSATEVTLASSAYVTPEGTSDSVPPVTTDSSVTGSVLVLRGDLSSAGNWTGADIAIGTDGNADLSVARTVAIALKNPGSTTDFTVYMQLGITSSGEWEDADTVRTWKLSTPAADSKWSIQTISLTDDDRSAISAGNDLRLVITPSSTAVPSTANPVHVTLNSGPIEVAEAGFAAESTSVALSETSDPLAGNKSLATTAASIITRFNSGSTNTVLEATLTPVIATEEIPIVKSVPALPFSSYKYLSFYLYCPSLPGTPALIRITLSRPNDAGTGTKNACVFELYSSALEADGWHKVSVDLENKHVLIDDTVCSTANARVISMQHSIAPTKIQVTFEDWPVPASSSPWEVFLDEFFLEKSSPVQTVRNASSFAWKKTGTILSVESVPIFSNPTISTNTAESVIIGQQDISASGNATAGISLLNARVDGSVSVSNATGNPLEMASHSVSVPLGPLSASERFATDFEAETINRTDVVSLAGPVAVGATIGASQTGTKLVRKTGFTVSPSIPHTPFGAFSFNAGSAFTQNGYSPLPDIGDATWSDLWQKSLKAMLSRGEPDATKRTGTTSFHSEWNSEGLILSAVKLDTEGTSTYINGSETSIDSALSYGLSFPFNFTSFSLTPGWKRTASEKKEITSGGSWNTDSETLAASLSEQPWLFRIAPVFDLFRPGISDVIANNGTWSRTFENTYSLDWQRPSPGLLSDLWTPTTITTSINRETETDATASNIQDIWSASTKAGFSALNIAGSQGLLNLFPWYEQDEISQLYGWAPKWGTGFFVWSVDTWHAVTLFFFNSGSVAVENTYHYDSPDISDKNELARDSIRLVWKRPGLTSPLIDPLHRITSLPLSTRREDSLTYSITVQQKTTRTITFTYDHLLTTGIGKNGELKLSTGTEITSTEDGLQTVEIKLGVGGKLSY